MTELEEKALAELRAVIAKFWKMVPIKKMLPIGFAIDRLCAILSLSPGERGFVRSGLDAKAEGDLPAAWDAVRVLADYYEESSKDDRAAGARLLAPQDGDVIVLRFPPGPQPASAARHLVEAIAEHLKVRGVSALAVCLPNMGNQAYGLNRLDENVMREAGWVRIAEAERMVQEERDACEGIADETAAAIESSPHPNYLAIGTAYNIATAIEQRSGNWDTNQSTPLDDFQALQEEITLGVLGPDNVPKPSPIILPPI